MTKFQNPIGAVLSRVLLAGLVVTAILSTPLQAHENRASDRHTKQSVGSSIPRIEGEGEQSIAAPAHHAFARLPSEQPGGVCDHGDDPMVC
ncbi:hypothetical protein QT608_22585 [Xanthomonas citri pv. citri]